MTVKPRYFLELKDLLALSMTCGSCQASYMLPIRRAAPMPRMCVCGQEWFPTHAQEKPPYGVLIEQLITLRDHQDLHDAPYSLTFEIAPLDGHRYEG